MRNILLLLLLATSCVKQKDEYLIQPVNTFTPPNLIQNPSFEFNGQSSLQDWTFPYGPCCLDSFSTDVPAGGGVYSLKLQPQWYPAEGAIEDYITGITANNSFLLKFYAKCINMPASQAYASVYINGFTISGIPSVSFNSQQWTQYQLTTSQLSITPTDTLVVRLSAGSTEVANWEVLFDKIELYKLP